MGKGLRRGRVRVLACGTTASAQATMEIMPSTKEPRSRALQMHSPTYVAAHTEHSSAHCTGMVCQPLCGRSEM